MILVVVAISIFFSEYLIARELSLETVDVKDFRSHLRPCFSIMTSQNELPGLMGFYNISRNVMVNSSVVNAYGIYDGMETGFYVPAFWGGFVASPNLSLFMQVAQGNWQKENITSFGPVINFIWGEEEKENVINIGIHHLKGPDDFRVKDISLSYLRKNYIFNSLLFYGVTSHYVNSRIEVENTDKKKTINENLYHFRTGIYKKFKFIDMGLELDLTKETVIAKYNLVIII